LVEVLHVSSSIVDLDGGGVITEEEKVEALRLMPVPSLSWDVVQECAMSTREHLGKQLVICKHMMQEQALLPKFAVENYFSQIFGKDLEEVVELSPAMWLLLVLLIVFTNNIITATMNEVLTSAASILNMRMSVFFLWRVEVCECAL
jgi:hypothetical protein